MGCTITVFESYFSERITGIWFNTVQGGVIACYGSYVNIQAIAPPENSVSPASILNSGFTGINVVITNANVSIPEISNFCSHSVNSGIIGSKRFFKPSLSSIASFIEPTSIEPKNNASITRMIYAPYFFIKNPTLVTPFLLWYIHKDLFCPSRAVVPRLQWLRITDRKDNPEMKKIERWLSLIQDFVIAPSLVFYHLLETFNVTKKQNVSAPTYKRHPIICCGQTAFPNNIVNLYFVWKMDFVFINLLLIFTFSATKWGINSLTKCITFISAYFIELIPLPLTQFVSRCWKDKKYKFPRHNYQYSKLLGGY